MAARYRWGPDIDAIADMLPATLFDEWLAFAEIQHEEETRALDAARHD